MSIYIYLCIQYIYTYIIPTTLSLKGYMTLTIVENEGGWWERKTYFSLYILSCFSFVPCTNITYSKLFSKKKMFITELFLCSPSLLIGLLHPSPVAQRVKHLPAMQETWVRSLGWEDPLEKEMATHSSVLAWRIPWGCSPVGYSPRGRKESDTTERLHFHFFHLTQIHGPSVADTSETEKKLNFLFCMGL